MKPIDFSHTDTVVIFGNPRSGTRMCANVLNMHPEILITGEWFDVKRLHSIKRNLKRYIGNENNDIMYNQKSHSLIKFIWMLRQNSTYKSDIDNLKYIGNKTPIIEHSYELLEDFFSNEVKYIYCIRNAYSVLESVKNLSNLAWNRNSVERNLELYLSSLRKYFEIKEKVGDRVFIVNIDDIVCAESNMTVYSDVFDFLGIEVDDSVSVSIDNMDKQNSMEYILRRNKKDLSKKVCLTESEIEMIRCNNEYALFSEKLSLRNPY